MQVDFLTIWEKNLELFQGLAKRYDISVEIIDSWKNIDDDSFKFIKYRGSEDNMSHFFNEYTIYRERD